MIRRRTAPHRGGAGIITLFWAPKKSRTGLANHPLRPPSSTRHPHHAHEASGDLASQLCNTTPSEALPSSTTVNATQRAGAGLTRPMLRQLRLATTLLQRRWRRDRLRHLLRLPPHRPVRPPGRTISAITTASTTAANATATAAIARAATTATPTSATTANNATTTKPRPPLLRRRRRLRLRLLRHLRGRLRQRLHLLPPTATTTTPPATAAAATVMGSKRHRAPPEPPVVF